jgi:indole-3-glycerol phosphate synthase
MKFLEEILAYKKELIAEKKRSIPLARVIKVAEARGEVRDFEKALAGQHRLSLIAEVKKASPSAGMIRPDFDHIVIAQTYERHGADAVSVLTEDRFFLGSHAFLTDIAGSVAIPLLCKDFFIDEYQIVEAASAGADAVLLIAAILDAKTLEGMIRIAKENRLASVVEVHTEDDVKRALDAGARMIGINNRDLRTFGVDLKTTELLLPHIPADRIRISESGIRTREDIVKVADWGADAVLIGETFMRSADIAAKMKEVMG